MPFSRRYMLVALAAILAGGSVPASADRKGHGRGGRDDDHHDSYDHEEADLARRSGEIRPLQEILDEVLKSQPGEVVGITFGKEYGMWVYEMKMVTPGGRYLEIYVDAKTGKIIKTEGK